MNDEAFLGRQPIVDAAGSLVAFELLFRSVGRAASGSGAPGAIGDLQASCHVIARSVSDLGLNDSLGRFTGYVNADRSLLMSDVVELLQPERFVLEILETTVIDAPLRDRLVELRKHGYRIALDDVCGVDDARFEFLPLVDIVKIDLQPQGAAPSQWKELARRLEPTGKTLLAEKVETHEQFQQALDAGFDLFQGYFFAKPQLLRSRRMPSSVPHTLRLIALLDQDPDIDAVAHELRRHPALAKPLLRQVNSSAAGRRRVDSIATAIALVGLQQIRRWAQLLLYAGDEGRSMHADPLVQQVGVRARMMELLAQRWRPQDPRFGDQAFLTGMLSRIDVLFGMPLHEALDGMPLTKSVFNALLERTGSLGLLLSVCEARECADLPALEALCREMGDFDVSQIALVESAAAAWTISQTDPAAGQRERHDQVHSVA